MSFRKPEEMETQKWEKTIFFVVFEDFQRRTQHVFNERKQCLLFQQKIHDQLPRCFCCFDDIANGLSYVDRVQHVLMCVGMKLPIEADFVFCFIFPKASRASHCFWTSLSNAQCRLSHQCPLSLCTENYLEKMILKWNANSAKFRLETGQHQIHRNWAKGMPKFFDICWIP